MAMQLNFPDRFPYMGFAHDWLHCAVICISIFLQFCSSFSTWTHTGFLSVREVDAEVPLGLPPLVVCFLATWNT